MAPNKFRTENLQQAAFVMARGAKTPDCQRTERGRVEFLFEDPTGKISALAESFYDGELVNAFKFYRATLSLRHTIDLVLDGRGAR